MLVIHTAAPHFQQYILHNSVQRVNSNAFISVDAAAEIQGSIMSSQSVMSGKEKVLNCTILTPDCIGLFC